MADYLHTVKKLVERLNLRSSDARFQRKKSKVEARINANVSEMTISENCCDKVIYRHRKQTVRKGLKTRGDMSGFSTGLPKRPASVSLYQLIKSNQDSCLHKNETVCAGCELNKPMTRSPKVPSPWDKKETVFQYNVDSSNPQNNDGAIESLFTIGQRLSPHGSSAISSSLLSPKSPMITNPTSPNNFRKSDQQYSRKNSGSGILKSPNPDLKSPLGLDPVFSENATTIDSFRKNSGTFRPRLSASKSVPLSPPAANAEKVAQQNGDFQLKLDTLRAELLAMRKADQELARRLLNLYSEIQQLKVKNSCMNYGELLDEAYYEAEMADEVPDMCDAPQRFTNKLLSSHGVTSFNIHSRRFSCS